MVRPGQPINIFEDYLPEKVDSPRGGQQTNRFLLELTRHTPRDFITLLNYLQRYSGPTSQMTQSPIQSAVRTYSVDYFVPEIKDELNGYFSPTQIDQLISLFSALGRREFTYAELVDCANNITPPLTIEPGEGLRLLFECSAVGNLEKVGGSTFFTVKYRNRQALLDLGKKLILHRGMWKALNLTQKDGDPDQERAGSSRALLGTSSSRGQRGTLTTCIFDGPERRTVRVQFGQFAANLETPGYTATR